MTKVQDINRLSRVVSIFAKYGFEELISSMHLGFVKMPIPETEKAKIKASTRWQRLCLALEECGPTYVKFGQLMANRSDLLPLDLLDELRKLQDRVPPFPSEQAIAVIQTELGGRLETLFSSFDKEPMAAASVAQVHKATLKSGEKCAIKVQRPNIKEFVRTDFEILQYIAELLYRHYEWAREFGIVTIMDELELSLGKELDFSIEASHIQRFANLFRDEPTIHVPKVHANYTTEKVLTLELIEATELKDILEDKFRGYDKKKIAVTLSDLLLKQLFEFGFFHGDPHPGNIFVMPGGVICFLDFGMMGILTEKQRENLRNLCLGIFDRDAGLILKSIQRMTPDLNLISNEKIEFEVEELLDRYNLGAFISELIKIMMRYHVKLPPNVFVLMKALVTIEGVIYALDPEYDLIAKMRPYRRFKPEVLAKGVFETLPSFMGKLKVDFEHHGLERYRATLNRVGNRIGIAIVIASLILGSSLLIQSKTEPVLGIAGFVSAGFLGLGWIISVMHRD